MFKFNKINYCILLFLRNLLSITLAFVLTLVSVFSNYFIVNAETNSTQIAETSEKQLIQCSDDWVIFRYLNSDGIFDFEVIYQNKSVEELKKEGFLVQYRIIFRAGVMGSTSQWFDIENKTELFKAYDTLREYPNGDGKYYINFQIIQRGQENAISTSDTFYLENEDNSFEYLYEEYCDLFKQSNKFVLNIKVNQHLKQTGNISATINTIKYNWPDDSSAWHDVAMADNYLFSHPISNVNFQNYSKSYTLGEKTYKIDYSIISLVVDVIPAFDDDEDLYISNIDYTLNFDGLVRKNTNQPVEKFKLATYVPSYPLNLITPIEKIKINAPVTTINIYEPICLTAEILPSNATFKKLDWDSSNWDYADVTSDGIVSAYPEGAGKTVTITAKSTDGSKVYATFKLYISQTAPIDNTPINKNLITKSNKLKQTMSVKVKTKKVKLSKVKKKKQIISKAIIVKKAKGTISYKKIKKGSSAKLSINKKTGKITVKKGTKKGVYKIKVKVSTKGTDKYLPFSKSITVKVKVK